MREAMTLGRLDALNEAIALNFLFLPVLSLIIYFGGRLAIGRNLKSIWYISLGLPGTLALVLLIVEYAFFVPRGYALPIGVFPILFPGYIFPPAVLLFHAMSFSTSETLSKRSFLLGIAIALTYPWTWFFFYALLKYE